MRIKTMETGSISFRFPPAGDGTGVMPGVWDSLESVLVRLEDDQGNAGWGEGFGYRVGDAVRTVVEGLIRPRVVGCEIDDIPAWNIDTQRDLHMFGRYGITIFALSAVDSALWDLAARRRGMSLGRLLSEGRAAPRRELDAYASLMRYGTHAGLAAAVTTATERGFRSIKVHENQLDLIRTARETLGQGPALSVDVNCQWSAAFIEEHLATLRDDSLAWVEEPVFPPEDFNALGRARSYGIPIAAGENWCTLRQFEAAAGFVGIWQPSVIKVGGISEMLAIIDFASAHGIKVIPHSPYYGPGFFATLQIAAARECVDQVEVLLADPSTAILPIDSLLVDGKITVPTHIGASPDVPANLWEH